MTPGTQDRDYTALFGRSRLGGIATLTARPMHPGARAEASTRVRVRGAGGAARTPRAGWEAALLFFSASLTPQRRDFLRRFLCRPVRLSRAP